MLGTVRKQNPIEAYARLRFFNKSGARLYIPEDLKGHASFPFRDGDVVRIQIVRNSPTHICIFPVEWWEMIDWKSKPDAYHKLPPKIRMKIMEAGLF